MKFALVAVNAKYIHSNPAIYSLKAYSKNSDVYLYEYTINQQINAIIKDIYKEKPNFIGFSCYIWNWEMIRKLISVLSLVLPNTTIWLGGPEVSYNPEAILMESIGVKGVMIGEGERTFDELVKHYSKKAYDEGATSNWNTWDDGLENIKGISYRNNDRIRQNDEQFPLSMDDIPFLYQDVDLATFKNRIIYYESSRGCPFSCSYCLSSEKARVRFRSIERVKEELQVFLEAGVRQVKFVDRTFNCKPQHHLAIWEYLLEHDNGITNFHFEISADLLKEEEMCLLEKLRPGLIQLEIGVQSTNQKTLDEIRRKQPFSEISQWVQYIKKLGNIHQHLDLIVGLPYENLNTFKHSFNEVFALRPDQFQVGFLKVLKGSYMHENAEQYQVVYDPNPPYEVLKTAWLSYDEVCFLKGIEEMVETYYNSGQFSKSLDYLISLWKSPFDFFEALAIYVEENMDFAKQSSRMQKYELLYQFAKYHKKASEVLYKNLIIDYYQHEHAKTRPSFFDDILKYKEQRNQFYKREMLERRYLAHYFEEDKMMTGRNLMHATHLEVFEDGTMLLFDYKRLSPMTKQATVVCIEQEE